MSQCKNKKDLEREFARIDDMCEAINYMVQPHECVKYKGLNLNECAYWINPPDANGDPEKYQFALSIIEDEPIFDDKGKK